MKRKHSGCADCEKNAIKVVHESGRNLNDTIEFVKDSGEIIDDLYVKVDEGFDDDLECRSVFVFRSSIDILRGVCKYCKRVCSKKCIECMWNGDGDEDNWFFDDSLLNSVNV